MLGFRSKWQSVRLHHNHLFIRYTRNEDTPTLIHKQIAAVAEGLNMFRSLIYSPGTLEDSLIAASVAADTHRILNPRCCRWLIRWNDSSVASRGERHFSPAAQRYVNVCDQHYHPRDALSRSAGSCFSLTTLSGRRNINSGPMAHPASHTSPLKSYSPLLQIFGPHLCSLHLRHRHPSTTRDLFST